jgi:N-methylhydantoinase A/oxoprolinase/acetone carboxylase beta subunit
VEELVAEFESAYLARYGYLPEDRNLEVESLRLAMQSASGESFARRGANRRSSFPPQPTQRFWDGEAWVEAPVIERADLEADEQMPGPCLIVERHTVTVVEDSWWARMDAAGGLVLERKDLVSHV